MRGAHRLLPSSGGRTADDALELISPWHVAPSRCTAIAAGQCGFSRQWGPSQRLCVLSRPPSLTFEWRGDAGTKLRPVLNELAFNLESFNPAFAATVLKVPALAASEGRAGPHQNWLRGCPGSCLAAGVFRIL